MIKVDDSRNLRQLNYSKSLSIFLSIQSKEGNVSNLFVNEYALNFTYESTIYQRSPIVKEGE
jgi:hypothetical protein